MTDPSLLHVACLDSHNTSYFYKREDGTYYWLHCRKNKDDVEVDVDQLQLDMFGDPDLSNEHIMKEILNVEVSVILYIKICYQPNIAFG